MNYRYGLGIDAGGTYTDAVILDFAADKIVDAQKAPTSQPDPSAGIRAVLAKMDAKLLKQVTMISLATTLATNALVEDRGAEAGVILVGYDDLPPAIPKTSRLLMIGGGHTFSGEEKAPLDEKTLKDKLDDFLAGLDAVAVSGFFSVRNPDHELRVARIVRERSDLPLVRGQQLSMRLDAFKRATTAWWNARLMPLISNLIKATSQVLSEQGLGLNLMVVRGDGTLMSAQTALKRPVDTLLSGPAASILGAKYLSGLDEALIVDMGGTTTDMAVLSGGGVALEAKGARVGDWETHVEAAKVRTIGLGGDSFISVNASRQLAV
ncbi:MAG: hydantoinase/oxoprolinase family protein, partial [Deltaproteobacteria bacterium]|nr:hydantoinase/oxoprolinase family protein [Deltaproteobacteria bacterium]